MLSQISSSLLLLQQAVVPPLIPAFDPRLWSSLRPATRTAYQLALRNFKVWAHEQCIHEPRTLPELDLTLAQYFDGKVKLAQARTLLAAIEKSLPSSKKHLPHARALVAEGERFAPPRHTVPLSFCAALGTAFVLATQLMSPRAAGLLILQSRQPAHGHPVRRVAVKLQEPRSGHVQR